jgi:hypothetical protein
MIYRKSDWKLFLLCFLGICVFALSLLPPKEWLPFAESFPRWLTEYTIWQNIGQLGPAILAASVLFSLIIILRTVWSKI